MRRKKLSDIEDLRALAQSSQYCRWSTSQSRELTVQISLGVRSGVHLTVPLLVIIFLVPEWIIRNTVVQLAEFPQVTYLTRE